MGKTLVSENRLDHFICPETNAIYMEGLLLTPGAKDALRNRGVEIVYGKKPESTAPLAGEAPACTCGVCPACVAAADGAFVAEIVTRVKEAFGEKDLATCWKIVEVALAEVRR